MAKRYRIGVIGFGRMGRGFVAAMLANPVWEVATICDIDLIAREEAGATRSKSYYLQRSRIHSDRPFH